MIDKPIDDMTYDEMKVELATLEKERAEREHDREQRATKFIRELFEEHAPADKKHILLSMAGDFAKKLISIVDKEKLH
jgi:hypothetical protein